MKARHLFTAHSGNVERPRKIMRSAGHILQMKHCNDNVLSRMAETPLFANLSESERKKLLTELDVRVRSYERNELIVHECEPATEVFVVLKGKVSVYECGQNADRRHLVYRLQPGDAYGATFPALDLKTNPGMVMANGPAEVLLCKVAKIREVIRRGTHAGFVSNLYVASARQGFAAWRKLTLVSCYEVADRILLYLRWRKEDGLPEDTMLNFAELAEYLGVNRTALYRGLDKLRKKGQIKMVDGVIRCASGETPPRRRCGVSPHHNHATTATNSGPCRS